MMQEREHKAGYRRGECTVWFSWFLGPKIRPGREVEVLLFGTTPGGIYRSFESLYEGKHMRRAQCRLLLQDDNVDESCVQEDSIEGPAKGGL